MIPLFENKLSADYEKLAYDFQFNDLDGSALNLSDYRGKVIIVVNVASQCGFTRQYEDMQNIWEKYQSKGVIILGVPSNDFGNQEPGNNKDIKNFSRSSRLRSFFKLMPVYLRAGPKTRNLSQLDQASVSVRPLRV